VVVATEAAHVMHIGRSVVHAPPRSRVLQALGNGSSIPSGGAVWPTAIYWSMVQVGTPPQDFPVAIDSGSGDLDIPGSGCAGCPTHAPNNAYDPKLSSTSKRAAPYAFANPYQTCDLTNPTAVCTIAGTLFTDKVSLAGLGPVDVKFGSIQKQTANFDQFKEVGGVLGFTSSLANLDRGSSNVFKQLVQTGACDNVWALCINDGRISNGTLTIGGVDERLSKEAVVYVPDSGVLFHSVKVAQILVGNESVPVNANGILDTGTNVLLVPSGLHKKMQSAMCADASLPHCDKLWDNQCFEMTEEEVDSYPPVNLELHGVTLEMSSRDYLLLGSPLASVANQYCIGIRSGGPAASPSSFIIGDTTMRNYYLVFDMENKRIGWGKVDRDACGSIDDSGALPVLA